MKKLENCSDLMTTQKQMTPVPKMKNKAGRQICTHVLKGKIMKVLLLKSQGLYVVCSCYITSFSELFLESLVKKKKG